MNHKDVLEFGGTDDCGEWKPIPRISSTIPFGYELDPDNDKQLKPIPVQLEALELAKKYIKNFPIREVADWISEATGRRISHVGLKKRLDNERRYKRKRRAVKGWATRLEKALKKVEEYETARPGVKG